MARTCNDSAPCGRGGAMLPLRLPIGPLPLPCLDRSSSTSLIRPPSPSPAPFPCSPIAPTTPTPGPTLGSCPWAVLSREAPRPLPLLPAPPRRPRAAVPLDPAPGKSSAAAAASGAWVVIVAKGDEACPCPSCERFVGLALPRRMFRSLLAMLPDRPERMPPPLPSLPAAPCPDRPASSDPDGDRGGSSLSDNSTGRRDARRRALPLLSAFAAVSIWVGAGLEPGPSVPGEGPRRLAGPSAVTLPKGNAPGGPGEVVAASALSGWAERWWGGLGEWGVGSVGGRWGGAWPWPEPEALLALETRCCRANSKDPVCGREGLAAEIAWCWERTAAAAAGGRRVGWDRMRGSGGQESEPIVGKGHHAGFYSTVVLQRERYARPVRGQDCVI